MKCPKCKSKFGYMRIKKIWVCRNCGSVTEAIDFSKKAKNFMGV